MKEKKSNRQRIDRFFTSLRRYIVKISWLLVDALGRFKTRIISIIITGALGVLLQLVALSLIAKYAQVLENKKVIKLFGFKMSDATSFELFVVIVLGIFLLLLLSAWLIYYSRIEIIRLGRKYEEFCAKRAIKLFGNNLLFGSLSNPRISNGNDLIRLARSDARCCSRILQIIMDVFVPSVTFVIATSVLFYYNALLTVTLFVPAIFYLFFLYRVNIGGVKSSALMEKYAGFAARDLKEVISRLENLANPIQSDDSWIEGIFASGHNNKFLKAYEARQQATDKSSFITNVLMSFSFLFVLLVLGGKAIIGGVGWTNMLLYLIALRYAVSNLRQLSRMITNINRFYPQLNRYYEYVQTQSSLPNNHNSKLLESNQYTIKSSSQPIQGSSSQVVIKAGTRMGVVTRIKPTRFTIGSIIEMLLQCDSNHLKEVLSTIQFVKTQYKLMPTGFRASLGINSRYAWHDLWMDMQKVGLGDKFRKQIPEQRLDYLNEELWDDVDSDLKFCLALNAALKCGAQWLIVEESGLTCLPQNTLDHYFDLFKDHFIIIVYDNKAVKANRVGIFDEDIIAVFSNSEIIGLGEKCWFIANRASIERVLEQVANNRVNKGYSLENDLDLDSI